MQKWKQFNTSCKNHQTANLIDCFLKSMLLIMRNLNHQIGCLEVPPTTKFKTNSYENVIFKSFQFKKKNHLKLFLDIPYSLDSFQIYPNVPMEYGCM